MWTIITTDEYEKDAKWYEKKHPHELAAILSNLKRYLALLNNSINSKSVSAGYLHNEPAGVVAIDQKAGGGNLQETRLYTFANQETQELYLITIGNKESQKSDIGYSKQYVQEYFPSKDQKKEK